MDEIYIGLIIVVVVVFGIKTINTFHNYKITIYPQIYSGFIEFLYRKSSEKRLSTSSWLEQNFGFHKIIYYTDTTNKKRFQKFFVLLIMSSGIYVINSKNLKGRIYLDKGKKYKFVTSFVNKETKEYGNKAIDIPNPIQETYSFVERISKITKLTNIDCMVQFLDDTVIEVSQTEIPMICSKDFFKTLESLHVQHKTVLNESEIEKLYSLLEKKLS